MILNYIGSIYDSGASHNNNRYYNNHNPNPNHSPTSRFAVNGPGMPYPNNGHNNVHQNHSFNRSAYSPNQPSSSASNTSGNLSGLGSNNLTKSDYYSSLPIQRPAISEVVSVPDNLGTFVADPKFQTILLKVKEQSNINTVVVNRLNNTATSIFIDAPNIESALMARQLIEIHFKQQLKLLAAEEKLKVSLFFYSITIIKNTQNYNDVILNIYNYNSI